MPTAGARMLNRKRVYDVVCGSRIALENAFRVKYFHAPRGGDRSLRRYDDPGREGFFPRSEMPSPTHVASRAADDRVIVIASRAMASRVQCRESGADRTPGERST